MATSKELNEAYKEIYNKDFPQPTLSRWVKEGKIKVNKKNSRVFDYNLEDFLRIIKSKEY
jgi:predicted site-specific integrase-resolvase